MSRHVDGTCVGAEVEAVHPLRHLDSTCQLLAPLLHRSGLCVTDAQQLRVEDVGFGRRSSCVCSAGCGAHSRRLLADDCVHRPIKPSKVIAGCLSYTSVDPGQTVECEITNLRPIAGTVVGIPEPRAAALAVGHMPTDSAEVRRVALGFDVRVPERFKDKQDPVPGRTRCARCHA